MRAPDELNEDASALARDIAELADKHDLTVAVAESLTGGKLACHLAAAPDSGDWFRGGIVAYASAVKFAVLGVPEGPVITEACAAAMARGAATAVGADAAVAVTGVGGPDPQEGQPTGTVCLAATYADTTNTRTCHFDGEPDEVLDQTVVQALRMLRDLIS